MLSLPREERLTLLRLTDKCWIPMQVAEALRQDDQDYLEEVKVAATKARISESQTVKATPY